MFGVLLMANQANLCCVRILMPLTCETRASNSIDIRSLITTIVAKRDLKRNTLCLGNVDA